MKAESAGQSYSAFNGHKLLVQGPLDVVALRVKQKLKEDAHAAILVFSDSTGKEMDFDLRGSDKEVLQRLQIFLSEEVVPVSSGPGRPKLGVVAREVSLLPRHWEWLATQPGGASASIRRLIEQAKRQSSNKDVIKQAQERSHKLMSALAGNLPNYEEALRALYAKDKKKFFTQISDWPGDVKEHLKKISQDAF